MTNVMMQVTFPKRCIYVAVSIPFTFLLLSTNAERDITQANETNPFIKISVAISSLPIPLPNKKQIQLVSFAYIQEQALHTAYLALR